MRSAERELLRLPIRHDNPSLHDIAAYGELDMSKALGIALFILGMALVTTSSSAQVGQTLALVGGTVYASPTTAPLKDAVLVVSGGTIAAVGSRGDVQVPQDARIIDCSGRSLTAGFWNSHVHFTEPVWRQAANARAETLTGHMQEMLTKWGFTTVWDLGSDPDDLLPLRRRVEAGDVLGPRIYSTGDVFPKGGHPIYLPPEMQLPEAATAEAAIGFARNFLGLGLDGMKLFTGSYMGDRPVVNMDATIAKAVVDTAHAQGKPVFAHPQNKTGVEVAISADVDILAHTVPTEPGYTSEQLAQFKAKGIALIPTLSLWTTVAPDQTAKDYLVQSGVNQLKAFAANGGIILFGTDVGFTKLYDTSLELEFMGRALSFGDVLASLTTNPAAYFKAPRKGRIEQGFDADIVVFDGDPTADVRNLAKVAYTIRAGRVIYQKP
jgi:imidazolonepropionase-like amidohydrolase